MSCGSCGTTTNGLPKGCKNNGACGIDTGCGKLPVFDWLSNMRLPNGQLEFNCVEVRFKNDRKLYYKNTNHLPLSIGDIIAVEAQSGHDIGIVTLSGELVRIQMKKKGLTEDSEEVKKVYRKANEKDIETWQSFREKEQATMMKSRRIAVDLGLEMKISDVEYQGDGTKAIFYYTAEGRVDFRELIKQYAGSFNVRIEMKQIGYRQEAAKVGGIGSCGRELCCSTWLTDFRSVNTTAARYQQLSINPQKLAGQCGKLKCCLNYELDSYLDALDEFPSLESTFETEKGTASCVKIDVFKKEMWFTYTEGGISWYKFQLDQAKEFISLSKSGHKTAPIEDLASELLETKKESVDVIGENSLERFERKNKKRNRKPRSNSTSNPQQRQNLNQNRDQKQSPRQKQNSDHKNNQKQEVNQKQTPSQKPEQKQNSNQKQNSEQKQNQNKKHHQKSPNPKSGNQNSTTNQSRNTNNNGRPNKSNNRNKRGPQNKTDENN